MKLFLFILFCAVFILLQNFCYCAEVVAEKSNVLQLNSETFDLTKQGKWLVKFYAPWCGHCKKLAPQYEEVAAHFAKSKSKSSGVVNVAKVNCDEASGVCSAAGVHGYPTIKYFADGFSREYKGGRKLQDFVDYVDKMSRPVTSVLPVSEIQHTFNKEQVSFFLVHNGQESSSEQLIDSYGKVASALLDYDSPSFYTISDATAFEKAVGYEFSVPAVFVSQSGDVLKYSGASDVDSLLPWAKKNQFPYLSQLTEFNFDTLTGHEHKLVLGVVDPTLPSYKQFIENLKNVAKKNLDNYVFASVDGIHFARWLSYLGIEKQHIPTLVVIDHPNEEHYKNLEENFSSPQKVQAYLDRVKKGEEKAQIASYASYYAAKLNRLFTSIGKFLSENKLLAGSIFGGTLILSIYWCFFTGPIEEPEQPEKKEKKKREKAPKAD